MVYEHRINSGSLWPNTRQTNERAPKLKGTAKVLIGDREIELEISAWVRISKNDTKWLSLSIKERGAARPASFANGEIPRVDDDIDF